MDDTTALHTAARQYCLDHDVFTTVRDIRCMKQRGPEEHWPRMKASPPEAFAEEMALGAILLEVERVVPQAFLSVRDLRAFLLNVGHTIEVYPIRNPTPRYEALVAETRQAFCAFIEQLSADDLHAIVPLPHRRVLAINERELLWQRLGRLMEHYWGRRPNSFWYPLLTRDVPPDILVLKEFDFREADLLEALHKELIKQPIRRIYRLRLPQEMLDQYEMDAVLFEPQGVEEYWTSDMMDWVLYASHENTLACAGEWLVNIIKQIWPEWENHLQTDATIHRS